MAQWLQKLVTRRPRPVHPSQIADQGTCSLYQYLLSGYAHHNIATALSALLQSTCKRLARRAASPQRGQDLVQAQVIPAMTVSMDGSAHPNKLLLNLRLVVMAGHVLIAKEAGFAHPFRQQHHHSV